MASLDVAWSSAYGSCTQLGIYDVDVEISRDGVLDDAFSIDCTALHLLRTTFVPGWYDVTAFGAGYARDDVTPAQRVQCAKAPAGAAGAPVRKPNLPSLVVAVACVSVFSWGAYAALGGARGVEIPFNGYLESDGAALDDATATLRFQVYEDAAKATPCGSAIDVAPVVVSNGRFAVIIGGVNESCVRGKEVFLGVSVMPTGGTFTELNGTQRIVPSLAAVSSGTGDFAVTGDINGLRVGDVGYGGAYPGVRNAAVSVPSSYALVQNAAGTETDVNAALGGVVQLRTGDVSRAIVTNAGLAVAAGHTLTAPTATVGTLTVSTVASLGLEMKSCSHDGTGYATGCTCPAGKALLSGGVECAQSNQHVNASVALSPTTWTGLCEDGAGVNVSTSITILCARIN